MQYSMHDMFAKQLEMILLIWNRRYVAIYDAVSIFCAVGDKLGWVQKPKGSLDCFQKKPVNNTWLSVDNSTGGKGRCF